MNLVNKYLNEAIDQKLLKRIFDKDGIFIGQNIHQDNSASELEKQGYIVKHNEKGKMMWVITMKGVQFLGVKI
jgi:hypothetical protein